MHKTDTNAAENNLCFEVKSQEINLKFFLEYQIILLKYNTKFIVIHDV